MGVAVAGASVGSPAAGVSVEGDSPVPSQAPRTVAKPNNKAKPKIFIFITPLSPIKSRTIFNLLNTIPQKLIFLNIVVLIIF